MPDLEIWDTGDEEAIPESTGNEETGKEGMVAIKKECDVKQAWKKAKEGGRKIIIISRGGRKMVSMLKMKVNING